MIDGERNTVPVTVNIGIQQVAIAAENLALSLPIDRLAIYYAAQFERAALTIRRRLTPQDDALVPDIANAISNYPCTTCAKCAVCDHAGVYALVQRMLCHTTAPR